MTDIINIQLKRAISRKNITSEVWMRFFRVHFRISMTKDVLEKRIAELR